MKDPVFNKLKADTGSVLSELFLALSLRPARKGGRTSRDNPAAPEMALLKPGTPPQSGLCYFHLN